MTRILTPSFALPASRSPQVLVFDPRWVGGQHQLRGNELPIGDEEGVASAERFDGFLHAVEGFEFIPKSVELPCSRA